MKTLHCRDVGFACDHIIRAENEDEVLRQAAEHGKSAHGRSKMTAGGWTDSYKKRINPERLHSRFC